MTTTFDNSLISTALLALQQAKQVNFTMNGTESGRAGFWFKGYANEDEDNEIMVEVFLYMDTASPTGYAVQVDVLDDETVTILDRPINFFVEFQVVFTSDYIQRVYNAHGFD